MNPLLSGTRCLSVKDTTAKLNLSRSSLYAMLSNQGSEFPRPIKIGRRTYFLETEVEAWILSRPRITPNFK